MNITCFIASLTLGGAERQLLVLSSLLAKNGHNVTLVTYSDCKDHYTVPDEVHRVRIGKEKGKLLKYCSVFNYFRKCTDDCIISYMQNCNAQVCISMMCRLGKRPRVICGERNLTYGQPDRYEKMLFKWLYKYADFIVPNSYSQAKHIKTVCPQWSHKVVTILNYTDVTKSSTVTCEHDKSTFRIAVFGRYDYQKNCLLFAESLVGMKKQSSKTIKVDWYGDKNGSPKYYEQLSHLVKDLNIEDVFSLNDSVSDPIKLMKEYDAICLPSLFEGFSNSIAEAICCAKPMVVSDVSDNSVMVHDGENGFLFNPLDKDSITSALLKIIALSDEELKQFGINSRKIAEELFNLEKFISQYLTLINS